MTIVARHRENPNMGPVTGTYWNSIFGTQYVSEDVGTHEECDDVVGNRTSANPFEHFLQSKSDILLNGTYKTSSGTKVKELTGVPCGGGPAFVPEPRQKYPVPTGLELSNLAWELLSKTNPNVPHVSVPTFVGELKDLPLLFKNWGGTLLQRAAKGNIAWQFAVKPMISDLRKMLNFQDAVDERLRWLKDLSEDKYLKRRAGLGKKVDKGSWTQEQILHSYTCIIKGRWRETTDYDQWGTVQYFSAASFNQPKTNDEAKKLAWKLATDVSIDGGISAVWNLLPWSWLIDWFVGFNQVIDATRNTVPFLHRNLCIMRTSKAFRRYEFTEVPEWVTTSGNRFEYMTRKDRYLASPTWVLPISVPAVTGRQWSILGSLGFLRSGFKF